MSLVKCFPCGIDLNPIVFTQTAENERKELKTALAIFYFVGCVEAALFNDN